MKIFGYFLLSLFVISGTAWSAPEICDLIDLPNCSGISKQSRRTSNQSYPSPATSASNNPAAVSFDRGLGVEVIHQAGNPLLFSVASGSGKLGGALISTNLENGFFGNRVVELDGTYFRRHENKKQYRSKKLTLALGGKLLRKTKYAVDAGILLKRHSEIGKINPGVGVSARIGLVSFGASVYQDDFQLLNEDFIKYPSGSVYDFQVLTDDYEEKFTVQTLSAGLRIKNVSIDAGLIKTKYKFYEDDSVIQIISGAVNYRNFLFNLATRSEASNAAKYEDGVLKLEKDQRSWYTGVQASLGKHLILGVAYNYFLLDEYSLNASLFF